MIGAGYAGRSGPHHCHLEVAGFSVTYDIRREPALRKMTLMVGDVAFENLDANGLIDQPASACLFAEPHAHTATGRRHGILLQDDPERMRGHAVTYVIDIAGDIHSGGTGFDARCRDIAHAVLLSARRARPFNEHILKVLKRAAQCHSARAPEAAQ